MTYQAVNSILVEHDVDMGPAEAHGIAVGMLCVELRADAANWLHELFTDEYELFDDEKSLLLNLFERTRELLEPDDDDFVFDLFLPDENASLNDQAEALRCWCQGFLFGVGYAHTDAEWPGDTAEVMRDMIELTKIDSDVAGEDDENALAEIHEYIRAAVFTFRDQFSDQSYRQAH